MLKTAVKGFNILPNLFNQELQSNLSGTHDDKYSVKVSSKSIENWRHFKGGNGPTKEFPDPVSAEEAGCLPAWKPPKRPPSAQLEDSTIYKRPRPMMLVKNRAFMNTDVSATTAPCSATQTAPCSATQTAPCSATQTAPCSAMQTSPCSATQTAPCSAKRTAPCSATQSAPCSATQTAPCSAKRTAPCSATQTAPCSATQTAPCSAMQTAPCSATQTAPSSATQTAPCSATQTAPSSATQTAPCSATQTAPCSATEENCVPGTDMLTLTAENKQLKIRVKQQEVEISSLKQIITEKNREIIRLSKPQIFGVPMVQQRASTLKGLFKYYTGITYIRFCALLSFLVPVNTTQIDYNCERTEIKKLGNEDGLFLTLCGLRHGFGLKDLATRFGLSLQSSGIIFNIWLDIMHCKLSQMSIWPHRDTIFGNMPSDFRKDFPTSLIMIDGTEIKTQTPSALALQSQRDSDCKSSTTTLRGLIGCDPNGSVMFVSELYTGSISDKELTEQSGFYECLKSLKSAQFIKEGDVIMADKSFNIHEEIADLGLRLIIPPSASSGCQMSEADTALANKIAQHRVQIERLICKVKRFKLLSHCVPASLFKKVNQIWSVCCLLTRFQDTAVKDKDNEDST